MNFYKVLKEKNTYNPELTKCIETTVEKLEQNNTTENRPGMLLGKIQSGKTRAFIGIMGLAFDKGYDAAVILTKGTKALATQTLIRLQREFDEFIEEDELDVFDIMSLPELTGYTMEKKLVFVCKKEDDNLRRLQQLLKNYPDLKDKQFLIIDDEADFASLGFTRDNNQEDGTRMNVLARMISDFRTQLKAKSDYLQVTATPYSLYLQPENIELNNEVFQPLRPAFTQLVPIHDQYIGGEFYFVKSQDDDHIASYLYYPVSEGELKVLDKRDARYLNNILESPGLKSFRSAIISFLIGTTLRRMQEREIGNKRYKCSFVVHTATSKARHEWQRDLVYELIKKLKLAFYTNSNKINELFKPEYNHLSQSLKKADHTSAPYEQVVNDLKMAFEKNYISVKIVNSDNDINTMLDKHGQLKLDNPYNIFVGGQILDRGITIDHMIGFFYGRNPNRFQQDTVLQHSRMYGARSQGDLAVTRFYTAPRIYLAMQRMFQFDEALREAFLTNNNDHGVVFIQRDNSGGIIPCNPNKILISETQTLRPHQRLLPYGFQTKAMSNIKNIINTLDEKIKELQKGKEHFVLNEADVYYILDLIASTFEYKGKWENEAYEWDVKSFKATIQYLTHRHKESWGELNCFTRENRNISRYKDFETAFSDAPDDGRNDLAPARALATNKPCLMLIRQNGNEEKGWRGSPFWWPVLVTPGDIRTSIFSKT